MDFSGYSGGITFTITSTYGLLHLGVIEPGQKLMLFAGIAFTTVVLGGVVSDVNVHSSKPRQGLGKLLKVSAVALLVLWILHDLAVLRSLGFRLVETLGVGSIPVEYVGLAAMVVLGLVTAKLIGFGLDELFKHRSFSHSKAFLGLYGSLPLDYRTLLVFFRPRSSRDRNGSAFGVFIHVYVGDR